MRVPTLFLTALLGLGLCPAAGATPRPRPKSPLGRVGGVVVAEGTPQLGATVVVTPKLGPGGSLRLVTDARGVFASSLLLPGVYTVRVLLAGFLPAFEPRVQVTTGQLTMLRIQMGSLFSSVEQLRQGPRPGHEPDEWKWVLRSASITRPVLRYAGGRVTTAAEDAEQRLRTPHGRAELTAGSLSAWSPVDTQPFGSTSFLYEQQLDGTNRIVLAGLAGYEHAPSAGFAATWTHAPSVDSESTETTTVVFRQSEIGSEGPSFRGWEIDSVRSMHLGGAELDYGGQYVMATIDGSASAFRPEIKLQVPLDSRWTATFLLDSHPRGHRTDDSVEALDELPTPVESNGRLALALAWHEEVAIEREVSRDATVTAAVFHDSEAHTAIFGRGPLVNEDTIVDPFSDAFVYGGAALGSWGARVAYQRQLSARWKATMLYSWSSALAPSTTNLDAAALPNEIAPKRRSLLGGRIAGRIDRTGTEVSAGYEWVSGTILNQPDPFGASLFDVEPYLNVSVRQPLPSFFCCRIVALIDARNVLAQGYVSVLTAGGRAVLIPAARAIRGGFAVQF